jgi:hypothetical protein
MKVDTRLHSRYILYTKSTDFYFFEKPMDNNALFDGQALKFLVLESNEKKFNITDYFQHT